VVAEKAGVQLTSASRAASSRQGGGGERGRIPAHTALDQVGRVEGFDTGSYARKPARQAGATAARPAAAAPAPAPPQPRVPRLEPSRAASAAPPIPPAPAQPAQTGGPARSGPIRFSSISGFRRR